VVENEDPKNQNRVKVLLSSVLGANSEPVWAYAKGSNPLAHALPPIGSTVFVEFLGGKLTSPVWEFAFPLKDGKVEEFKSPKSFGFKTPAGYLVLIDEADKLLKITTPTGQGVSILENIVTIKNTIASITLDDSGISVDAGEGDILLYNDGGYVSITDSGIDISAEKAITIGGQYNVLYSLVPRAKEITDVAEIGVSQTILVGA